MGTTLLSLQFHETNMTRKWTSMFSTLRASKDLSGI